MLVTSLILCASESGDWYGLYINNELYHEGHDIPTYSWVKMIDEYKQFDFGNALYYDVSDEGLEELGGFPKDFNDIPKELLI